MLREFTDHSLRMDLRSLKAADVVLEPRTPLLDFITRERISVSSTPVSEAGKIRLIAKLDL